MFLRERKCHQVGGGEVECFAYYSFVPSSEGSRWVGLREWPSAMVTLSHLDLICLGGLAVM